MTRQNVPGFPSGIGESPEANELASLRRRLTLSALALGHYDVLLRKEILRDWGPHLEKFWLAPFRRPMTDWLTILCGVLLCGVMFFATPARAQEGIQTGDTELRVWAGGGHATNGVTRNDSVWNIGVRYGWVITKPMLPRPLRGRLEYALDFMPAYVIYQSTGTAYGVSFNPINLKWIFDWHGRIVPYTELEGGVLLTNVNVPPPPGNSTVNFTTSNAIGAHFLTHKFDWSADVRFLHISNAGLKLPNEGVNTVQVRVGFGLFQHHKK